MNTYKYIVTVLLAFLSISCDDANELLDQYIKDGPIVYAGKIEELDIQSGYHRLRVNMYPAEDVNRSYCVLSWQVSGGVRDSVKVDYTADNYDEELECYYTFISLPAIEGNLLIESQNVDVFGNRSLIHSEGAFVYGSSYVSTLMNLPVHFSDAGDVLFENRIGVVGHIISYEQSSGQFTPDIVVDEDYYPLVDAKVGGIIRSKTLYLMTETDIDTLETTAYLETVIEDDDIDPLLQDLLESTNWVTTQVAPGVTWKYYHFPDIFDSKQYVTVFDVDLNNENIQIDIPYATSGFISTSTAAVQGNADIAFNGSYFNTNTGKSTVYFKSNSTLIAPTVAGFCS